MLVLASLAVVVTLVVAISDGGMTWMAGPQLRLLLSFAVASGLATLAVAMVVKARTGKSSNAAALEEAAELRRSLLSAEAILRSEPQVLAFWEPGQSVRVTSHTLSTVAGLPAAEADVMRFGQWLDRPSAGELKQALDGLFETGRPFNLLLRTSAGGNLEADGRSAGGRAILRLRDVAGYKRDLARIVDQQRELARDIRASRAILDALPIPVWTRSADGRLDWVNSAYVTAVEADSAGQVRERQIELLESRQREQIKGRLAAGQPTRERLPLIVAGERKPHDIVVLPLDDASAGAAIDVAAAETARGDFDRLIAAYDRTLHRVASGVAIFGPDQRLTFFNEAYRRLWQLDPTWLASGPKDGEILDRLRSLSRLPEAGNYRDWKTKILDGYKSSAASEDWWHLLDGRTIHVLAEPRVDGGVTYLYDDATERLALESRYNALIDAQRETLDNLKEGVAVFAPDGRLKLYNSAFVQIWRLSRAALAEGPHIDGIIDQCKVLFDDMRTWTSIGRAITGITDRRQPIEGNLQRVDQSLIDFVVSPLPDGATLIKFTDVTDAKRYERALIERNDALIAADRLKSQFISHVSYELRTPLTNIIGFSELMESARTGGLNPRQREYIGDISASSKTLLSIINDILDLATIDAGALELKLAPAKVRSIVDAAVLGIRERASRARLNLVISIADDATDFIADEARVRQVLYNILSNAIGFSKPGDTIRLGCWREGQMIAFAVEDQGVGIPKEQQQRVLQRFETLPQGSRHRGAGLGLSIVKSLVELHGGNMALDSEPGRGTRVTVRLPVGGLAEEGVAARPQRAVGA